MLISEKERNIGVPFGVLKPLQLDDSLLLAAGPPNYSLSPGGRGVG
jgi:hypothetical protein